MKVIKPNVTIEYITPDSAKVIERAGRTCYKSEDKISDTSADKFVRMLIKKGHTSVLEHAVASFRIVCDRGVGNELVRHRIASYSQESTRYCRYNDEIQVIEPPGLNQEQHESWACAVLACENEYMRLLKSGVSPQIARSVLPLCLKTEIVMTANFRSWRNFLQQRMAKEAHPQMREIAELIASHLMGNCHIAFSDLLNVVQPETVH